MVWNRHFTRFKKCRKEFLNYFLLWINLDNFSQSTFSISSFFPIKFSVSDGSSSRSYSSFELSYSFKINFHFEVRIDLTFGSLGGDFSYNGFPVSVNAYCSGMHFPWTNGSNETPSKEEKFSISNLQIKNFAQKIIYYNQTESTTNDLWKLYNENQNNQLFIITDNQRKKHIATKKSL